MARLSPAAAQANPRDRRESSRPGRPESTRSLAQEKRGKKKNRARAKPPSLEVRHLHWGRLDAEAVALAKTGFDVVIGADVLYGKSRDFDALFATARLLLKTRRGETRASS